MSGTNNEPVPATAKAKPYIPELDLIRAIAILAVVMIHATGFMLSNADEHSTNYLVYKTLSVASSFAVPAFIFLSGYVMFYSYLDKPLTRRTISSFYRKRALTIVLPYILFSLIYMAYHSCVSSDWSSSATLSKYAVQLLTGGAHTHLYYIFVIIQYYLLFPFLLYAMKKTKTGLGLLVAGVVLQWGYYYFNREVVVHLEGLPNILHKTGSLFISYLAYYLFGAFLAANAGKFRDFVFSSGKHRASWATIAAVWLASGSYYVYIQYMGSAWAKWADSQTFAYVWFVYLLASCLVLFKAADWFYRRLNTSWRELAVNLGKCSFGVFFVHPLVLIAYRHLPLGGGFVSFNLFFLGEFLSAVVVSWAITYVFMRSFSWSWVLFGSSLKPAVKPGRPSSDRGATLNA